MDQAIGRKRQDKLEIQLLAADKPTLAQAADRLAGRECPAALHSHPGAESGADTMDQRAVTAYELSDS